MFKIHHRFGLTGFRLVLAVLSVALLAACNDWQADTLARPPDQPKPALALAPEPALVLPRPPPSAAEARNGLMAPKPLQRPYRISSYAPIDDSWWPVQPLGPVSLGSVEPINVVGLSEDETVNLLGEPTDRAWRPPSRVLRYASDQCSVDIYFYLDVAKDSFQALQLKATDSTLDESAIQNCLGKVRNEHRTR